jgi:alginate O-acetyltransferase complex protein AlgI
MLFNSPEFLFVFLPAALAGTWLALRAGQPAGLFALIFASLVFYAWWRTSGLAVIGASIIANFLIATRIDRLDASANGARSARLSLLWLGIGLNLAALGYFKYANFFLGMVGEPALQIVLPLAISFFSFQQIAFLVDTYRGAMGRITWRDYAAAVLFFPHLIAGPLIHYSDIAAQFRERFAVTSATIVAGLPIFAIGLAKKVAIADSLAPFVSPLFAKAETAPLEFFSAWLAALGYTAQLYFDFSGYSDMAIGLAIMFGISLPINFASPYKAGSIIEFWRRWHITLSHFLRDYLYFPLGGGRRGPRRRYANLLAVMLLGGLWHGAAWTFVFWGGLHGAYLAVNHFWRRNVAERLPLWLLRGLVPAFWLLTFLAVVVGWVFFRSPSFAAAINILEGMAGQTFASLPGELAYLLDMKTGRFAGIVFDGKGLPYLDLVPALFYLVLGYAIIWAAPNTAQMFGLDGRARDWAATSLPPLALVRRAVAMGLLLWVSMFGIIGAAPTEFLYFQF